MKPRCAVCREPVEGSFFCGSCRRSFDSRKGSTEMDVIEWTANRAWRAALATPKGMRMSNSDPNFGRPAKSYHLAIPSKTALCVAACETRPNFLPRRKKWISDPGAVECPDCLEMMKAAPK